MNSVKRQYETPKLVVYGDLEKITLSGSVQNSDTPQGNNNTAYSPVN